MPKDYRKAVLEEYQKKKENGELRPNLLHPTPGSIREECLIVSNERNTPKDLEILRQFFRDGDIDKGYLKSIQNSKAETFKQLPRILDEKIPNPSERFIELIAWLIDFKPRPSTAYYMALYKKEDVNSGSAESQENAPKEKLPDTSKVNAGKDTPAPQDQVYKIEKDNGGFSLVPPSLSEDNEASTDPPTLIAKIEPYIKKNEKEREDLSELNTSKIKQLWQHRIFRKSIIATTFIVFSSVGTYAIWNIIYPPCMYWNGDHYERISCDQDSITSAIAYNEKTAQIRRITRPDTVSKNALGKVWYFKVKVDSADFFTAGGEYPLDRKRVLRPLTDYILRKYVLDKKEPAGGIK